MNWRVTNEDLFAKLTELQRLLQHHSGVIEKMERTIMSALSDLQASVAAEDTVIDSAMTLLKGLSDALKAAGTDPAALAALKADLDAKTSALSAAIVANTPAAP